MSEIEVQARAVMEPLLATMARDEVVGINPCDVWCAMANVLWVANGIQATAYNMDTCELGASWSFREAGSLISAWRDELEHLSYMDWYCCGPDGVVSEAIRDYVETMAGYRPVT